MQWLVNYISLLMQVKQYRFFIWYDWPINDEHAKVVIIELRNTNKDLV